MRGIIYYCDDIFVGVLELTKIIDSYAKLNIDLAKRINLTSNSTTADFANGDQWLVVKATESAREYACNIAYIDEQINPITVRQIIMPTIKSSSISSL